MDVHKDEKVFVEEPTLKVPDRKGTKGKKPTKLKANIPSYRLDKLQDIIHKDEWKTEFIRDTTKGKLRLKVCKKEVWFWDGKSSKTKKRVLIITRTIRSKPKIKYSISNGDINAYSHQEFAYFVSQRYCGRKVF